MQTSLFGSKNSWVELDAFARHDPLDFVGLFCFRVLGQVLVTFFDAMFLPPMEEWYSGLLPYPYLLPTQIVIISLLLKVNLDLSRGTGFFARSYRAFGRGVMLAGLLLLEVSSSNYPRYDRNPNIERQRDKVMIGERCPYWLPSWSA